MEFAQVVLERCLESLAAAPLPNGLRGDSQRFQTTFPSYTIASSSSRRRQIRHEIAKLFVGHRVQQTVGHN